MEEKANKQTTATAPTALSHEVHGPIYSPRPRGELIGPWKNTEDIVKHIVKRKGEGKKGQKDR